MTGVGKITTGVAIVFMLTSLTLAFLSSETARDSVVKDIEQTESKVSEQQSMPLPDGVLQEEEKVEDPALELEQKAAPPVNGS